MEYIIQEPVKKRTSTWVVVLFFVALSLLIFNYVLQLFTPQGLPAQELVATNYDNSKTTFNTLTFTGLMPQLPTTLPTAEISTVTGDNARFEQLLLSTYNLKPFPQIDNIWQSDTYSLTKVSDPVTYVLIQKTTPTTIPTSINISEALNLADKTIATLFPNQKLQAISQSIQPYIVWEHPHPEPATAAEANAVEISYGYQFGPYSVLYGKDYTYPVTIIITGDGKVGKITSQPFVVEFKETKSYSTLTLSEALQAIENGDGSILYQSYRGSGTPSLATVVSGQFTSVTIEYRVDDSSKNVIPYYRLTGTLTNNENIDFEAEVITPAIPIKR